MRVKVKDILPNPFRKTNRYPIMREKVLALRESIKETTFWDNIVARKVDGGKVEIAYGHHRLQALKDELGGDAEVNLIVRDLSDEEMFKVMARENLEEWKHDASIARETVRSCIEGYTKSLWSLRPDNKAYDRATKNVKIRLAPEFAIQVAPLSIFEDEKSKPYTA
jgi:ParB-like chromosome segregation protein Spo0J